MTPQEIQENYFLLFQDSFITSLFPHRDWVMRAMLDNGLYSKPMILALATVGSVLGLCMDYVLARTLVKAVYNAKFFRPYVARHQKCVSFVNKHAWAWLLIVIFDQAELVFALVGGALRLRILAFLSLVALAKAAYFVSVVYYGHSPVGLLVDPR